MNPSFSLFVLRGKRELSSSLSMVKNLLVDGFVKSTRVEAMPSRNG